MNLFKKGFKCKFLITMCFLSTQVFSQEGVGKLKHLIYHDIKTDNQGNMLPWYSDDPATAYNFALNAVWIYWKNIPGHWVRGPVNKDVHPEWRKELPFPPKYLIYRTLEDLGVGGDQFAQLLSSWNLYYDYSGNEEVMNNMIFQADWYLKYSLSKPTDEWPLIPYPCNMTEAPVYDGDLILGKDITQPDKAGSFGAELIMLYKKTGNTKYLNAAVDIANTLAKHTRQGDSIASPLPFKVNAVTGEIKSTYTTNWVGTIQLFEDLIKLEKGNTVAYKKSFDEISEWFKNFPMKDNRWGPFFEDIKVWSDTEINEGTLAWYILTHPKWSKNGLQEVRKMQDWTINKLGIDQWKQYGMSVIGEQSVYKMQGQSHTARHASIELQYAALTGNNSMKEEAIRQLNFCTYAVDFDGKCRWMNFDTYEIWWSDGYGDFVRHFIRAMAAAPELAPSNETHILSSTSVLQKVNYTGNADKSIMPGMKQDDIKKVKVFYKAFDNNGQEKIRMLKKPSKVIIDNKTMTESKDETTSGYSWKPLAKGGLLTINRNNGSSIIVLY